MATVNTSELTGPALDWAVAKCENLEVEHINDGITKFLLRLAPFTWRYSPSTDWSQGGPIIEREGINVEYDGDWVYDPANQAPDDEPDNGDRWLAAFWNYGTSGQYGPTPLIAAMRCYVTSRLGEEAEVPDELA